MTDQEQDTKLLELAHERYGTRKRCRHQYSTLCQYTDPDVGWFAAYQCDECGMVLRTPVSAADLDLPDLPYIDHGLWLLAIDSVINATIGTDATRSMMFFERALAQ